MATDQAPAANGLTVKPPPNIIIPPKVVRDAVAKTAEFVVRRGEKGEIGIVNRVRQQVDAGQTTTVAFILPEDDYHPYYLWYCQQLKEGKGTAAPTTAVEEKPKGPPPPSEFRFSGRMPQINAKDLEILKLTAQYTARVGENWLKELRNRESGNFQFEFLRPTHSFNGLFRSLVDQYKILLEEDQTVEARINELEHNIRDRFHVLERAKQRADYTKYVSQQKEKEEKKVEDEKREYASIDWHDFNVIATVLFDEVDEAAELPEPYKLADLQSASLEQKAMTSLSAKRIEEAMPDEVTYYNASQQPAMAAPGFPAMPHMAPPIQSAYGTPPPIGYGYQTPAPSQPLDWQAEEARKAREFQAERDQVARAQATARGAPSSMRIRTDYVPRGKKANAPPVQCPNCKQMFPSDEITEHMRSMSLGCHPENNH